MYYAVDYFCTEFFAIDPKTEGFTAGDYGSFGSVQQDRHLCGLDSTLNQQCRMNVG